MLRPIVIAFLILLSACASRWQAPVGEIEGGSRYVDSGRTHRVDAGETLYAIAFMHGLDYIDLARANDISPPYTIYPGQRLLVDLRGQPPAREPAAEPETRPAAAPATPPVASRPSVPSPRAVTESAPPKAALPSGPVLWAWPADGPVIKGFAGSDSDYKGIDIAGREGDPVRAAAAGEVVYAGRGLLRYGDMIIIKHDERFLSAYAHNHRLLVEEGERVSRGQQIAELGSTGVDRDMLHFEIRLNGDPVDPARYLPGR